MFMKYILRNTTVVNGLPRNNCCCQNISTETVFQFHNMLLQQNILINFPKYVSELFNIKFPQFFCSMLLRI